MCMPKTGSGKITFMMQISTALLAGLAVAVTSANGALTRVTNFGSNPTNLEMNINVPARLAQKPAIILAVCRSLTYATCSNSILAPRLLRYW